MRCVKQHKADRECSGERDRSKLVPRCEYDENTFYSDYFFLEDVGRVMDRSDLGATSHGRISKRNSSRLTRLKFELNKRGTVICFAPAGMNSRTRNTTYFNPKEDLVYWYIRLVFAGCKRGEFYAPGVRETTLLSELVLEYLAECRGEEVYSRAVRTRGVSALQAKLTQPSVMVLLDMDRSIRDNLHTRRIMEFPFITVMLS